MVKTHRWDSPETVLRIGKWEVESRNGKVETTVMSGTLYVVATPIGNLEDITYRAVRVLGGAAIIFAEDTRRTGLLLKRYEIDVPMRPYHDHNKEKVTPGILARLEGDESVALVSDAGTPGISDPGFYLVVRAIERGVPVVPVPGPTAVVCALSAAGLPTDRFEMVGFLPKKAGRRDRLLEELVNRGHTVVVYESARRLPETLRALAGIAPEARVVIGRELTKLHEEWMRGTATEVRERLGDAILKGEIVLLFHGGKKERKSR